MTNNMIPIDIGEKFQFACHKNVACFNECCQDLNQFLTPYDILRLKKCLNIKSYDFLKQYTDEHSGPESGLPIITLKMTPESNMKCPFVTDNGCNVYKDRPASCRMYPLARAIARDRNTGQIKEYYALLKEEHCLGFQQSSKQTVKEWIKNQDLSMYNKMNDKMMDIISLKNRLRPGPLDLQYRQYFHMALYDIDTFKEKILEKQLPDQYKLDQEMLNFVQIKDEYLLEFAMHWVKNMLFGIEIPNNLI